MRKFVKLNLLMALALLTCFSGLVNAATKDDAKQLVDKAIKYIDENGMDKAKVAFKDKSGEFIKGELYLFVISHNNVMIMHPIKANLENKNLSKLRAPDGTYFIQAMTKKSKENGEGWVDYKWANPATGKVEPKSSYVKRIGQSEMYVGCGIYSN